MGRRMTRWQNLVCGLPDDSAFVKRSQRSNNVFISTTREGMEKL